MMMMIYLFSGLIVYLIFGKAINILLYVGLEDKNRWYVILWPLVLLTVIWAEARNLE